MDNHYLVALFLLSSVFHGCMAQLELPQKDWWLNLHQQQQHRLRAKTSCQIQQLDAREPSQRFEFEAGYAEFWESESEDLGCAGIQFVRHVIQPGGLLLPHYANAPQLTYIIQGSGIEGVVVPGCAETFEYGESERRGEGDWSDRHQKLRRFRQGDVIAFPQGFARWTYNDGDQPIISVSILDVANDKNQLDLNFRKFFLAGNPTSSRERRRSQEGERQQRSEAGEWRNIFSGFNEEFLAEAFNVDNELIRKLQSQEDNRGFIVKAERPRFVWPESSREEEQEQRRGSGNGLEETFCTLKLHQNIDNPARADFFNPRGGRISTINSQTLPILSHLRLSAERGIFYKNALQAPKFSTNAHTALYVTRGNAKIQVVDNQGNAVFDGEVKNGQLLVIPQNYAVVKRAGVEGFEWISFKTNDNAMSTSLAGRLSALRSIPVDVLANAYDISREDAGKLKFNREEATIFSPMQSRQA